MYYGHSMMIHRRDFSPEAMTPIGHRTLVPLMDLCQHSTDANCVDKPVVKTNEAGEPTIAGIQMVATRDIKRGEGITSNYGFKDGSTWF